MVRFIVLTVLVLFSIGALGLEMCMPVSTSGDSTPESISAIQNVTPSPTGTPQGIVTWVPSGYRNIIPGKSTYIDVKRVFGTPRWEGQNEDKEFEDDPEFEILLQYSNRGDGQEAVEIVVGEKTKIVKSIIYFPAKIMTREDVVGIFGTNFFEIETGNSLCIDGSVRRGPSTRHLLFPRLLVYPENGRYVSIAEDGTVMHVGFAYKCQT